MTVGDDGLLSEASKSRREMAGPTGFEPAISTVTVWRGQPLLYGPTWLGWKESNPHRMIQSHASYRWTTSQKWLPEKDSNLQLPL